MFRPTLNMKPYFCWSPWFHLCKKPERDSTQVEEHWEPQVLQCYQRMIMLQAASIGNNLMLKRVTVYDYFEQQEARRANFAAWERSRDAESAFRGIKMNYARELSYALHYERLVRQEEESNRIVEEQQRKYAALDEAQRLQDEADAAAAAEAVKALPPLPEQTVTRIRNRILAAIRKSRWDGKPRAMRRLLKGLPLVSAGI